MSVEGGGAKRGIVPQRQKLAPSLAPAPTQTVLWQTNSLLWYVLSKRVQKGSFGPPNSES